MILINDRKGSYGYFSRIGRKSIKENALLFKYEKNKIFVKITSSSSPNIFKNTNNNKKSKIITKENILDIFTIEELENENFPNNTEDISNDYIKEINLKNKNKLKKNKSNNKIKKLKSKHFHYYNHIKEIKKNYIVPSNIKYNPKYDAILRRSVSAPLWKSITGRKDQKKDIYDFPFYLKHESIQKNMAGKAFIDFSKQTLRKSFLDNKNNKENYILKRLSKSLLKKNSPFSCINKSSNSSNMINFINNKITNINIKNIINKNDNDSNETNNSNDSYEIFKNEYTKKILKRKIEKNFDKKKNKENKKIKSINFDQIISRETLDELKNNKISDLSYLFPNYISIRERPIMMVAYNRKEHKINKSKPQIYKCEDFRNKEKIKNHIQSPNFELMTPRPFNEKDSLLLYMKKIFDKSNCYKINRTSLKLNNYSNRGFSMNNSSFKSKKKDLIKF